MPTEKQIIDESFNIAYVAETGSTNDDLRALVLRGEVGAGEGRVGMVLVADYQTGGKGRMGRSWVAEPKSALLASILVQPDFLAQDIQRNSYLINACLALSARSACAKFTGREIKIKWPNDLVVCGGSVDGGVGDGEVGSGAGYKKLAGILCELVLPENKTGEAAFIMGIGINLKTPNLQKAGGTKEAGAGGVEAVGLNDLAGKPISRDDLLQAILLEFRERYLKFEAGDFSEANLAEEIIGEVTNHLAFFGEQIQVEQMDTKTITGKLAGLTLEGHLLLETQTPTQTPTQTRVKTFSEGDVRLLRKS